MTLALLAVRAAAVLLAVPPATVTAARLVGGDDRSPIPQLAAFAPWALLGWLGVVVLLVVTRWWLVAALAGIAVVLHVAWLLPPGPARAAARETGGIPVRAATVNTQYGEADPDSIVRMVREGRVDLLAVQELEPDTASHLSAALHDQLPYAELHPVPDSAVGTGLWSRWPVEPLDPVDSAFRTPKVRVRLPGAPGTEAVPVTVTAVHPVAPHRAAVSDWNRDLSAVAAAVGAVDGPQLVLGDFNATRDHLGFRAILGTGLVDAADAAGTPWSGFTWPADRPRAPAAVRIDHILVSHGSFGIRSVQDREIPGTDHRAVVAEVVLTP